MRHKNALLVMCEIEDPVWFGLVGLSASATARVILRFGLAGLNASATVRVISRFWFVRA